MDPVEEAIPPLRVPQFRRLLGISITVALGFGMLIPVLPAFARSFGVGLATAGLVQLVFGLTRFSFGVVGGLFVDRFGDRSATITGILIVAVSSYAAGLSQTFPQLVMARGFGGAGSALFINGLMARILRVIEPQAMGRATGDFRASFLIGIAAGPVLGGLVAEHFGTTAPFHFYATGLLLAATIAWFAMASVTGEARAAEHRNPIEALRAARPLLGDIRYLIALGATFVGWWTLSGPAQFVGVNYADEVLGLSSSQIGLATSILAVGEIAAVFSAGWAADRYGRRAVLVPSLALAGTATFLIGQIQTAPVAFYPLMVLLGAGIAASGAAAGGLLADAIPRGGSGAAIGVNQMAGDLGYLIAPSATGWVAEGAGYGLAYLVGALPAGVVAVGALRLPGRGGEPAGRPVAAPEEPATPVG